MRRVWRLGWLIAVLLASLPRPGSAQERSTVEYLYVEANEGGSSGGHVAFRLGDDVFHFEHRSPGILVLRRADFERFVFRYGVTENRTIHRIRIPVSGETQALLAHRFRQRLFLQMRHLDVMESLRGDRATLEQMLSGGLAVEGAGYFVSDREVGASPSVDIGALRARVEAAYGPDFLDRRTEMLHARLAALEPVVMDLPELPTAEVPPAPAYTFPQRYRDVATALEALQILRAARPLAPGALVDADPGDLPFTDIDAQAVRRLSEVLEDALVRLVASERPDWGAALVIGMARLAALGESRRHERWMLLDAFPVDSEATPRRQPSRGELSARALDDAGDARTRAREELLARLDEGFPEAAFAALEAAVNHVGELRAARAEERAPRAVRAPFVPSRPARMTIGPLDPQALMGGREAVRDREEAYASGFRRRWGYNLVTRNCVSEIFGEIDAAFEGGAEEARERLGGRVGMDGSLNFIPAVSAAAVASSYPATEQLEVPSYRRARVAQMYREENPVAVFLRESNTLTSAIYRRNPDDSIFVFFTDDAVLARPLFGAVNLVVGLGASAVGLATLPVDGGATLWAGLRGALFSVPELFFQNIRKGSFEYVGRERRVEPSIRPVEAPGGG